jgi:hypothetical protein
MKNLNVVYLVVKNNAALCCASSKVDALKFVSMFKNDFVSIVKLNLFDPEGFQAKLVQTEFELKSIAKSATQFQN